MHEFETIETGVLAALTDLKDNGVRIVEPYAGQIDEAKGLSSLNYPFVYVGVFEINIVPINKVDFARVEVWLWVGAKDARGVGAATKGSVVAPGIWDLLEIIRSKLNNKPVVPNWSKLSWRGDKALIVGPYKSVAIYESNYTTLRPIGQN